MRVVPASNEIRFRRPVWEALSELFLDTELMPDDFQRLGRVLAESPYTLHEVEHILYAEVSPVLIWNLLSVAGEWECFDADMLEEAILKHQKSWFWCPRFLLLSRGTIRGPWKNIKTEFLRCREHSA